MMPYAISQIIEQIARVAYMLGSCFLIMKVMKGDYTTAVVHSTFAAFVGVIFAMGVLLYFFLRQRPYFKAREAESLNQLQFSGRDLVIQMIKEAVPFIIVGSGTSIFKIIDQYTFEPIMGHLTSASAESLERLFALFAANPDKLTMVVISIATSLASASLPLITEKYTRRDQKGLSELIANNLQLFFFVMLPATVGMIIVAFPMNTLFYKADHMGTALLVQACLTGIMMGLFMMASSTLQGLNGNRSAIFFLGIGLLVKILTQFPLIFFFHAFGPLLASLLGYLASCLYLLERIYRISRFPLKKTLHGIAEIIFLTAGMAVAAILALKVGSLFLSPDRKAQSFMLVMFVAVIGGGFYLYLSLRTRIADRLMGAKAQGIRRRLHIR